MSRHPVSSCDHNCSFSAQKQAARLGRAAGQFLLRPYKPVTKLMAMQGYGAAWLHVVTCLRSDVMCRGTGVPVYGYIFVFAKNNVRDDTARAVMRTCNELC